jgi:hypothetical protein
MPARRYVEDADDNVGTESAENGRPARDELVLALLDTPETKAVRKRCCAGRVDWSAEGALRGSP